MAWRESPLLFIPCKQCFWQLNSENSSNFSPFVCEKAILAGFSARTNSAFVHLMTVNKLLVATRNPGKLAELRELVSGFQIEICSLEDLGITSDVAETGATFRENAVLKARSYAAMSDLPALADDSGLEVNALGGAPGVLSARYAGADASYAQKIGLLLREIAATGSDDRSARFVSVLALARPDGSVRFVGEGICTGTIAESPRGSGGFGYDPVFVPDGYTLTFAELAPGLKNEIGHRARAAKLFAEYLRDNSGI